MYSAGIFQNFSNLLDPIYLKEPFFTHRFAKKSRFEDPYVRIFDIADDIQQVGFRVAIKDYSASTQQQRNDVLMNLESYRGLEQTQGICKLVAFSQKQNGDIIAAFQYDQFTLEQLINYRYFHEKRNQLYLFILKELLSILNNAKSLGIGLEDLIPTNILFYQISNDLKIKLLYDERQKKYDKIGQGIKSFCSVELLQSALRSHSSNYQASQQFIFQLGLLLLDTLYVYEKDCLEEITTIKKHSDLDFKGYHLFQENYKSNIIEKNMQYWFKAVLKSLKQPLIIEFIALIEEMIYPIHQRIHFQQLISKANKLSEISYKGNQNISILRTPRKQKFSQTSLKNSLSDSLKYSEEGSPKYVFGTNASISLTKNVFIDQYDKKQSKGVDINQTSIAYNLIPKNKIMAQIKVHQNIKSQLKKFIEILQNKATVVRKDYLDGSIYYGELGEVNQKRQGFGMYFYTHGDVYFGKWSDNKLIDGTYIFKNSECFEGIVKNGKQGWGRYYYANGNIYEGDWRDDLKSGRGKMIYSNGDIYEGMWKQGKKHGQGFYYYHNGAIYEGNFLNGKKAGFGRVTFLNKTVVEAFWVDNRIDGKGKIFYNNGNYYEGQFCFSEKAGQGIYKWQDETQYIGEFKKDIMLGQAKIKYIGNQFYEGKIVNGKREGYGIYKYPNGDQYRGEWKNDEKIIGQYKFNDGRTFDGRFKRNQITYGVMIYQNGDSYEGQFTNGQRHGLGLYRDSKGSLKFDGKWVKDKFIGSKG